ncbi:hypothetical protein GCM10027318_31540 [Massilia agilis]
MRYCELHPEVREEGGLPNYKVMKQVALKRKLGGLYGLVIWAARFGVPLNSAREWICALVASLFRWRRASADGHIISMARNNIQLIKNALASDKTNTDFHFDDDLLNLGRLAAEIGPAGVMRCIGQHLALLGSILGRDKGERVDLLLHSRDAFSLIMLGQYIDQHPEHLYVTECHYQRWSYMLAQSAPRWKMVQHGFIDPGIRFKNQCGAVPVVYARDHSFHGQFSRYYAVGRFLNFTAVAGLHENPFAMSGLFLASSFPSIDAEIALIRKIKARSSVPIILKIHPSHAYDARKDELLAMADYVCNAHEYPDCRIFVSNNSFMEYDYQFLGKKTFAISRFENVDAAAESIMDNLQT